MSKETDFLKLLHYNSDPIPYGTGLKPEILEGPLIVNIHTADPEESNTDLLTLDKYTSYVKHGQFIRDGEWYIDEYNVVAIATPQEIAIAEEYDRLHRVPFNRLSIIE